METIKIWPGWEIKEQVGEGDLGKVFRIERTDAGITREAALKVIEISGDPGEIKMYRKMGMDEDSITEIYEERKNQLFTAVVRLSCLRTAYGIASVEDFDSFWNEEDSSWTILIRSEFLESLDAYGKKKDGDLLPYEIAEMGRDIAGALMTLEKEGITTLSVKPSNILRNTEGAYKLSDAGINEGTGRLAASKVGTLFSWDAPELVRSGKYDQTSDIYSLGMVMYVLLNGGKRPFMEEGGVLKRWMKFRIANERRVSGEPLPNPVSGDEELQKIVLRACAPDPEDRYQNAEELKEALEIWLFGQKYGKRVIGADEVSPDRAADEASETAEASEPSFAPAESEPSFKPENVETEPSFEPAEAETPSASLESEAEGLPESAAVPEAEPVAEAAAEPEAEDVPESAAGPEAEDVPEAAAESEAEVVPEAAAESEAEAVPEAAAEPEAEIVPEVSAEPEAEDFSDASGEPAAEEEPEQFVALPAGALEKAPVFLAKTDSFAPDQNEQDEEDKEILRVKAEEEDPFRDAAQTDQPERISLFKKTEEEPPVETDIRAEIPSVSVRDEGVHEKELNPFEKDFFSSPEPFELPEEAAAEPVQSSEEFFHSPDLFDSSEEKSADRNDITGMPPYVGFGEDEEVTALIEDSDRRIFENPAPVLRKDEPQSDEEESLDDSVAGFFRTGADLDDEGPGNEEFSAAESSQPEPVMPAFAAGAFFGGEAQDMPSDDDPYAATMVEEPSFEEASEPEKKEIPPTADVFIYIFQRDDRLFGIHSVVSENAGGARLKMKSEILETGLFEMILDNLGKRTELPIENAFVTIGSGASQREYEERKEMVLAAGLKSVTVLDDAAVNALGVFAEDLVGQEGEHYVLSVIHDYSGFHSSLLKFDTLGGSGIRVLKSAPTMKVINPNDNPAFIMDRMLQDNCRVDGVDYSDRVERVLVDNRNRPLMGSVGQGSFDPYYNEVYGSIFQRANLYEGIEALRGLAYYDSCEKGEKNGVRISLSVFEEPVKREQEEYSASTQEKGVSEQAGWMGFGMGSQDSATDFRNDRGSDMAAPDFSTMESTMMGADPFAAGKENFSGSQDPFGAGGETFGSSQDPFGAGGETFGSSPDPFGAGGETFGGSPDPFGAGGDTFSGSRDPFGAGGDTFNATVAGDAFSGQTNGSTALGKNPFGDELTADGFGGSLEDTSAGNPPMDGFGGMPENKAGYPGISYSDRGRIYMLNEKKPINDVTMEVNEGGIDLFRKDMKIALAFGMIGSAIEGKGKKFAHIDFAQIRGFGYETPNPKTGPKPALYTADGKVYIFDFANAANTENILRQIAGSADGSF